MLPKLLMKTIKGGGRHTKHNSRFNLRTKVSISMDQKPTIRMHVELSGMAKNLLRVSNTLAAFQSCSSCNKYIDQTVCVTGIDVLSSVKQDIYT